MRRLRSLLSLLLLLAAGFAWTGVASAQISVNINIAPPVLPVYVQPPCLEPGLIWTPGYWAWGPEGYYWVPGVWVAPPRPGLLWTPGYWAWNDGLYVWNAGYWGIHVGFYGGVNYGFGYGGFGFEGGYWDHDHFMYNRAVTNVNVTKITNVYNKTVINNNTSHVAYNGGTGGVSAKPTKEEEAAAHEEHIPPAKEQVEHEKAAAAEPSLRAKANHGRPPVAATSKPGVFKGPGVVRAERPRHEAPPKAEPRPAPPAPHPMAEPHPPAPPAPPAKPEEKKPE